MLTRLIAVVLAIGLLAGGVPRLLGQLAAQPGQAALALLHNAEVPSAEAFDRLLRSREQALTQVEDPRWRLDLGAAQLARALDRSSLGADRTEALDEARGHLRSGLARSAAEPEGWLWLAAVEMNRDDWAAVPGALRLSLLAAPFEPNLALSRARVGLAAWPWLDLRTRRLVERELGHALKSAPEQLIATADGLGRMGALRSSVARDRSAREKLANLERNLRGQL